MHAHMFSQYNHCSIHVCTNIYKPYCNWKIFICVFSFLVYSNLSTNMINLLYFLCHATCLTCFLINYHSFASFELGVSLLKSLIPYPGHLLGSGILKFLLHFLHSIFLSTGLLVIICLYFL